MMSKLFFSIGPVQGFIAAARRTRDLWAGSWLLSHLAEQAVAAVTKTPGVALLLPRFAKPEDQLQPIAGTPNRLIAEGESAALKAAAENATKAIDIEWRRLAGLVWDRYVNIPCSKERDGGARTTAIWKRQIDHFWEIHWVIGPNDHSRKAWRSSATDVEPGYRCALFAHLQELSGHISQGKSAELTAFWERIRERIRDGDGKYDIDKYDIEEYDIEENEALSAIGLIKRLYPRLKEFSKLDITNWPSTAWVAALPWIKRVKDMPEAKAYRDAVVGELGNHHFDSTAAARTCIGAASTSFACFDGQLFYDRGIKMECQERDTKGRLRINEAMESAVLDPYQKLTAASRGRPAPWYALLLMDGDQIGKLLSGLPQSEQGKLSAALKTFASQLARIVRQHDGRTIYAGGDDVMALLPATGAIACAQALRAEYASAFESAFKDELGVAHPAMKWVGISAGLVLADWKTPLNQVLDEAHNLLNNVAKDATGRDALAISVWLSSGRSCLWAAPWHSIGDTKQGLLADLLRCGKPDEVSASFLYGVRESIVELLENPYEKPGSFADLHEELDISAVLRGDLVRIHGNKDPDHHGKVADALTRLSQRHRRITSASTGQISIDQSRRTFSFDGLRLARFLAQLEVAT